MDFLEAKIKEQLIEIEYRTLSTTPPWMNLAVHSPWKDALLLLMGSARVNKSQRNKPMFYQGVRDLCVIEHILRRWDKDFSISPGSNRKKKEFQLQGEILKHSIGCLDWFLGMGLEKLHACVWFLGLFREEALTPWASKELTKAKAKRKFQSENKQLMGLENPFSQEKHPCSHAFVDLCCKQSERSDDFKKKYWYPLVRSRMAWTTFYIDKGFIAKLNAEKEQISLENRGRSKNKLQGASRKPLQ